MRLKAITLLFFFVTFLTLPTFLSQTSADIDISMAYTIAEEEENHSNNISEVFSDFTLEIQEINLGFFGLKAYKIKGKFLLRHVNGFAQVFSPPPEQKLV